MQPAGLWDEVGSVELQVTHELVEDTPATRAYRVAARLRSSRFGLLTGAGAIRQDKFHPERGWVLDALRADGGDTPSPPAPLPKAGRGVTAGRTWRVLAQRSEQGTPLPAFGRGAGGEGAAPERLNAPIPAPAFPAPCFEVTPAPSAFWDGATVAPRLVVRTWYGQPERAGRYLLEAEATLEQRSEPLPRPAPRRQVEVRVVRPELPPSDLRRAIENVAEPGSAEAAAPLPPRAEETAVQVRVLDAAGRPMAGEQVRVRINPTPDSGGHTGVHSGPRPHGWLLAESAPAYRPGGPRIGSLEPEWLGTTDAAGAVRLRYRASELAGVETLSAELVHAPDLRGFVELRVGLSLLALPPNPDTFLVGGTLAHPSLDNDAGTSHFVAADVLAELAAVAAEFRKATGMPLRVNDSSLPWGGVFDIDGGWERPHYNHRDGTDVDLAVFGYPAARARMAGPAASPAPDMLFRAPSPLAPDLPAVRSARGLTMAEVEIMAGAVRRHGGRPGFEGDHVHASFGPIRFAEGPPRPKPVLPEELAPELRALLESLEPLPDEPAAPAAPAPKMAPAGPGRPPVAAPAVSAPPATVKSEHLPASRSRRAPPAPRQRRAQRRHRRRLPRRSPFRRRSPRAHRRPPHRRPRHRRNARAAGAAGVRSDGAAAGAGEPAGRGQVGAARGERGQ